MYTMFDSYDNLPSTYIPDNTTPPPLPPEKINNDIAKVVYDIKGRPQGISWKYGDEFRLELNIEQTIRISPLAIVYQVSGECPTTDTGGFPGQQAYNTMDYKSWTCIGEGDCSCFIWVEDPDITYPPDGQFEIKMFPPYENGVLTADIYNFRWEKILSSSNANSPIVYFDINKDTNEILKPGVYNCLMELRRDNENVVRKRVNLIVS